MNEYREVAIMLRTLLRNSGAETPEHPIPAVSILSIAQTIENMADDIELEMIIEMQRVA
tara:strand:+ start:561 stop:737 length:177 start_codon:yes stop_codon:yes gene_type:complete